MAQGLKQILNALYNIIVVTHVKTLGGINMIDKHKPNEQFNFNVDGLNIITEHYKLFRDNRFTKKTINNRHDLKMGKYNNAGYGFRYFLEIVMLVLFGF